METFGRFRGLDLVWTKLAKVLKNYRNGQILENLALYLDIMHYAFQRSNQSELYSLHCGNLGKHMHGFYLHQVEQQTITIVSKEN